MKYLLIYWNCFSLIIKDQENNIIIIKNNSEIRGPIKRKRGNIATP